MTLSSRFATGNTNSNAQGGVIGASLNFMVNPTSSQARTELVAAYETFKPGYIDTLNDYLGKHPVAAAAAPVAAASAKMKSSF